MAGSQLPLAYMGGRSSPGGNTTIGVAGTHAYGFGPTGNRIPIHGYVRHGSDERGYRPRSHPRRHRSNSPDRFYREEPLAGSGRLGRASPAGPVERQEWLDALGDVSMRVQTLENTMRNHAQSIAVQNACTSEVVEKITSIEAKLLATDTDIDAYKKYLNKVMYEGTDSIAETLKALDRRNDEYISMASSSINLRVTALDEKIDTMQATLDSIVGHLHQKQTGGAQHFGIDTDAQPVVGRVVHEHTGVEQEADPLQQEGNDSWKMYIQHQRALSGLNPGAQASGPRFFGAQNDLSAQAPTMSQQCPPEASVPQPNMGAPMGPSHARFQTPFTDSLFHSPQPTRPSAPEPATGHSAAPGMPPSFGGPPAYMNQQAAGPNRYAAGPAHCPVGGNYNGPPPAGGIPYGQQASTPYQMQGASFEICRKKNESLKKFNGSLNEYITWRERMIDHLCRKTGYGDQSSRSSRLATSPFVAPGW